MAFVKVKECLTNPRQLIKLILVAVCVCITIYQLSECVNKIVHPPITSYYKFTYNKTIKYPALTVCRRPSFKRSLFPLYGMRTSTVDLCTMDAFKTFNFDNYTLEEFLTAVTYTVGETIPLYGYKGSGLGQNVEFKRTFHPKRGLCHTIIPKGSVDSFSIQTGYWLYLKHTTKDKSKDINGLSTSGFEIHIHNENDVIEEEAYVDDFLYLESSEDMHVTLTVQTYTQVSTAQTPCRAEPDYSMSKCEEKCLHNAIAREVGCTVPWLRYLEEEYEQCSNNSALNEIGNLFSDYRSDKILKKCDCPRSCNNSVYKYQIESRKETDMIQAPSSSINIYFASNLITDLTEVISYDWNFFLADVGGSLGFLLGLSVIGFVTVIEEIIKLLFRRNGSKEVTEGQKLPPLLVNTVSKGEGESLKSMMEFMANCDMYQHLQEEKKVKEEKY